jgi:hypothetical protein
MQRALLAAWHGFWILACAGMTEWRGRSAACGNDGSGETPQRALIAAWHGFWIPACAGMTGWRGRNANWRRRNSACRNDGLAATQRPFRRFVPIRTFRSPVANQDMPHAGAVHAGG